MTRSLISRRSASKTASKKHRWKADVIFRLASMTRPIVSVAAVELVEKGQLDLAPVSKHLPEFNRGNPLIPSPSCRDTLAADDLFANEAAWVAVREIV
jgi:CubicO group peptidase (beta-lactamase class C family)